MVNCNYGKLVRQNFKHHIREKLIIKLRMQVLFKEYSKEMLRFSRAIFFSLQFFCRWDTRSYDRRTSKRQNKDLTFQCANYLAGAVTTKEDHILESVETDWAHGLLLDVRQLLLKLLHIPHAGVAPSVVQHKVGLASTGGSNRPKALSREL